MHVVLVTQVKEPSWFRQLWPGWQSSVPSAHSSMSSQLPLEGRETVTGQTEVTVTAGVLRDGHRPDGGHLDNQRAHCVNANLEAIEAI